MTKHLSLVLLSLAGIWTLSACTQPPAVTASVWNFNSHESAPNILSSDAFKDSRTLSVSDEKLESSVQKVAGIEIDGAYLKKISDSHGKAIAGHARYFPVDFSKIEAEILADRHLLVLKNELLPLIGKDPEFSQASQVLKSDWKIKINNSGAELFYLTDFIDSAKKAVHRLSIGIHSQQIQIQRISSAFQEGRGLVFPAGPKSSALAEVVFNDLLGDGTLSKEGLLVQAQVPEHAEDPHSIFSYSPSDARFDQVQAFFFADRALSFFQNHLGVKLPFTLSLQTQYGAPERLNAMFYYHGQIRLGLGDGITYAGMMKDPSIVIHETSHALIEAVAQLPMGEGEGGSINEAFADFIAAAYTNNPRLGEVAYLKGPFKRTLANPLRVSDKNGGLYHDSQILSGTLWDIHQALGSQKALKLAMKMLARLGPDSTFASIAKVTTDSLAAGFALEDRQLVIGILNQRGW